MPKTYVAWIVRVVFKDQSVSYHGPFLTESRAKRYATDAAIVNFIIEPLVIPHAIGVEITER